jgi:hypothetical protein
VARVNVKPILTTSTMEALDVGAWVNIMGTVQEIKKRQFLSKSRTSTDPQVQVRVNVLAHAVWSAGSLNVAEYEEGLELRRKAGLAGAPLINSR